MQVGGALLDVGVAVVAVQEQVAVGGVGEQTLGLRTAEASLRPLRSRQQACNTRDTIGTPVRGEIGVHILPKPQRNYILGKEFVPNLKTWHRVGSDL